MTELNTPVAEVETEAPTQEALKTLAKVKGFVVYSFENQEQAQQTVDALTEETLNEKMFKPCGKFDQFKSGYAQFQGEGDNYLLNVKGSTMFQITTQEKRPHAATVKKLCRAKEEEYLLSTGLEKVASEAKAEIKFEVIEGLISETEPNEPETTLLWVTGKYLVVGCATYKKAEDYVAVVRGSIGSCPVQPVEVAKDVQDELTNMLAKSYAEQIILMDLVHLENPNEKGIIKFEKESAYEIEKKQHLLDGYVVNKMQMSNEELCTFTLNKNFEFSGVKISKEVLSGMIDIAATIVTVAEINATIKEVIGIFGEVEESVEQ